MIVELEVHTTDTNLVPGQKMASITLGGVTIFSSVVYDNDKYSAEQNILALFGNRLRRLLEDE